MNEQLLLQLFLAVDLLIVGALIPLIVRYFRAHRRGEQRGNELDEATAQASAKVLLRLERRIAENAVENFESSIHRVTEQLYGELKETSVAVNRRLEQLGDSIIDSEATHYQSTLKELRERSSEAIESFTDDIQSHQDEMREKLKEHQALLEVKLAGKARRYETLLDDLREQAEQTVAATQAAIIHQQTELQGRLQAMRVDAEAKLQSDIVAEKARLTKELDTKLADAVTAFLMDAMRHNVDLGAQTPYLLSLLEEHKSELIAEVTHEA